MKQRLTYKSNRALFAGQYKNIESLVEDEIFAAVNKIANDARTNVPVDTGFLQGAIIAQSQGLVGRVDVNMHYAPYIEFGTGGFVDVPEGLGSYAMQFKGKGIREVNMPPQPFLYPAFFSESEAMMERLRKEIE